MDTLLTIELWGGLRAPAPNVGGNVAVTKFHTRRLAARALLARLMRKAQAPVTRAAPLLTAAPAAQTSAPATSLANEEAAAPHFPTGMIAILTTDIVGSTALGRRIGEAAYAQVRKRHHDLLRREFHRAGGYEFKETGDGFWVAFDLAYDGLACAKACQDALAGPDAPQVDPPLRVRMALHVAQVRPERTGPEQVGIDYHSLDLHDAARLLAAASGGQILISEAAEAVLRRHLPDGVSLVDRGVYLLRDAPAPERLFEARWPGMPVANLPLPQATPSRSPSLPPVFTRFVGREAEIEAVAALLSGPARLVTLTGLGGTGKTRLALEVARAAAQQYAGAVWFVPLTDIEDAARLPDHVRAAVGAPQTGDLWAVLDSVLDGAPSLLVLDNLEQFLHCDGGVDWIQTALERWPRLSVLATSRQRLDLPAEHEYSVAPLPTPAAADRTPEQLLGISSVALFEDRARRARQDFRLTERNAQSVVELCTRLEGIPLGLELAAAWTRVLTPAEMLAQLPQIRRSRDRNLPERHRSLAAAIEGSYRLLDDQQRQFFRRLAVFRGGCTVEAAGAVTDEPDALSLLADLRDRSLVTVAERDDGTRYSFLETLREFAEAKLAEAPNEAASAASRFREYFAALVAEAEPELKGPDQARWLARLAVEHENLRATLDGLDPASRLIMASQLHRYWMVRGYVAEGRGWLNDAADDAHVAISELARIKALNVAGVLALSAGDLDNAQAFFTLSRNRAEAIGNEEDVGSALGNLATVASLRGDLNAARRDYEASLPLWRRLGATSTLAIVLSNLGAVVHEQKDLDAARGFLEESLSLQTTTGDLLLRANTLHNLAEIAATQGDFVTALHRLHDCLQVRLELEDMSAVPNLIFLLAGVKAQQDVLEKAAWLYGAGEAACRLAQTTLPDQTRESVDAAFAEVQIGLGDAVSRRFWEQGCSANWKQILDCVSDSTKS